MPARNSRLARRIASAAIALPLAVAPAAAQTGTGCRVIRALTNADGRGFARVSLGFAGKPQRVVLRGDGGELMPAPDSCDFSAMPYGVDISCFWPTRHDSGPQFDELFASFNKCLTGLTPPTGPSDYGGAKAVRRSTSTIPVPGGTTDIDLVLIESDTEPGSYVSLSISYEVADPE